MGLEEFANWFNYPKEAQTVVHLDEDSITPIREVVSLFPDISKLVATAESITLLENQSEGKNKRYFPEAMDTKEEDIAENPKRKNIETEGQLVLDKTIDT